jgi:xanthine dehydrogenase accessory factor
LDKQTIWQWLSLALQLHQSVALLIVVGSKGSSPGKTGAKLAITADKDIFGTIGGGKVEHDLCEYAVKHLKENQQNTQLFTKQHHTASTEYSSGQICGGEQTVALVIFKQSDLPLLQKIQQAEASNQPIILEIKPHGLTLAPLTESPVNSSFNFHQQTDWCYQSVIGCQKIAYIIGGGHVSLALTQLLALLDFKVIVIDQRTAVKTMEENALASQKLIMPYSEIAHEIIEGMQSYVFVMTHSHETDQQVVELLAKKNFKYFGILGSHRKISLMKKNLTSEISEKNWQPIHAPIGLPINSHTPMEIAISIGAELIQFDNESKH